MGSHKTYIAKFLQSNPAKEITVELEADQSHIKIIDGAHTVVVSRDDWAPDELVAAITELLRSEPEHHNIQDHLADAHLISIRSTPRSLDETRCALKTVKARVKAQERAHELKHQLVQALQ